MMNLARSSHWSNLSRLLEKSSRFAQKRHNSIKTLQAAFRDPSSPLYLAPGTQGPASPDEPSRETEFDTKQKSPLNTNLSSFDELLKRGRAKLVDVGFDSHSIWEQPIAWGDQDSFQHVNNVHHVRFFESSRIRWMIGLGHRIGGPAKSEALLKGKGISLIIKSLTINYRRPVTYPDTLLLSHKPAHPPSSSLNLSESDLDQHAKSLDPACLYLTSSAFSAAVTQQAFVTHCNETLVWYDYDKLKKCIPGEEYRSAVWDSETGNEATMRES